MAMPPLAAKNSAVQVVVAALQSGSVKLIGPTSGNANENAIAEDSKYLNGLINSIAANLQR